MATKKPLTREEYNELDRLAKMANQRLSRMIEGQREAIEYYTHGEKFSRKKPKSRAEYNQRMRELERFLAAEQTKKRGWEALKKLQVENAGKTLRKERKYTLTDDELSNVLKELDKKSDKQFYTILDLVQAKKWRAEMKGKDFDATKAVKQAIASHIGAKKALREKTAVRTAAISAGVLRE